MSPLIKAPVCLIIAGPNGAGKTTFAREFLPHEGMLHFVNADLIAAGRSQRGRCMWSVVEHEVGPSRSGQFLILD